MNIISYNVNGIRSAMDKGLIDWLKIANPDVLCLQEIKALKAQIDVDAFEALGYNYHYWYSADKKGYSGVGIVCKAKPKNVVYGTGVETLDGEGRNLRVDFDNLSVMSLYLPSGTNTDRLGYKFGYMDDFRAYIDALKAQLPGLVISGDYNICHRPIDIHDPIRNANVSGFLPSEREWLDRFIGSGFIDTFRFFNPEPHQYSWWSYRANSRNNNKGWRIDYHLASKSLENRLKRACILPEARHSDHCPILLELDAD